ncbi:unnamed protein product [Meloidogyne enterolobii]|uniref:Uncharacterized protein n=1 Tax=Meloidogyne enterolobii TaxID=390850 RepID=A0ACB0ZWC0_MELEN
MDRKINFFLLKNNFYIFSLFTFFSFCPRHLTNEFFLYKILFLCPSTFCLFFKVKKGGNFL